VQRIGVTAVDKNVPFIRRDFFGHDETGGFLRKFIDAVRSRSIVISAYDGYFNPRRSLEAREGNNRDGKAHSRPSRFLQPLVHSSKRARFVA
jgi:hypothetical protein